MTSERNKRVPAEDLESLTAKCAALVTGHEAAVAAHKQV